MRKSALFNALFPAAFLLALPAPALAYIGPGAGLGAISALIAVVIAIVLIFVGFIWFPLRRMMRKRRARTVQTQTSDAGES
ncbi:hypothetical protein [Alloyangia pacifica]|uniref:hypothetical protein n=1 Tax=Alloyangia pacifica TaxID=311180 RepID=UPI001CD74AA6|nr:hypothetical protein [Alloyangia pacifica]MCA0998772.1 hypothetical protein [Alloyangia pacifica]